MKIPEHKKDLLHRKIGPVKFAVIITSDTRTTTTDQSGKEIINLLTRKGHSCIGYQMVKNNLLLIRRVVRQFLTHPRLQLIITSGGTGCGKKDLTIEAVTPFLEKKLDGFGEFFRALSLKEIGTAAMMSRALLGITQPVPDRNRSGKGKIICCLPGSAHAVKLALTKLLLPELSHLIWEVNR